MNIAQCILIGVFRVYKTALSPALAVIFGPGTGCRFEPTCSCYAMEAVRRHGVVKGSALTLGRLARCHPWGGCGADPVPERLDFVFSRAAKTSRNVDFIVRPDLKANR